MYHFTYLAVILFTFSTINISALNPSQQGITLKEYKRILPLPPVGLTAIYTKGSMGSNNWGVELAWKRYKLESITSYEVYRSRGQKKLTRIATTRSWSFFDKKGRCNDAYTVKAVRYDGTKSRHSSKVIVTSYCKK